ncbi:MAG TPA: A/G-specific adenine glycosylase [Chitinophagaceae bacterium]|mgnify:CR=1 FL=1|nr:A/G-specific adenine glycosylase [Chitinophagaceae bacterium]
MKTRQFRIAKGQFSAKLLKWDMETNNRKMPWKGEKDPYRIWLSEIILQQTRVEQGLQYYQNFIKAFPDIHKLAKAPESKIFKLWEGLGYYSRCRNLIATAKYISKELKGVFPDDYNSIKSLKGVGPYTAAAISSFAFNLLYPVVDGNVYRVLARIFGINEPIDNTNGKKIFNFLAEELIDKREPGRYNQAIMDFGATICKPQAPLCDTCIFKKQCYAFLNKNTGQLPVKEKRIKIKERWFYYLVLEYKNTIAIRQRKEKDIWRDLYEFPLIELKKKINPGKLINTTINDLKLSHTKHQTPYSSSLYKQKLSHQLISGYYLFIKIDKKPILKNDWLWVKKSDFKQYTFPRFINSFLSENPIKS